MQLAQWQQNHLMTQILSFASPTGFGFHENDSWLKSQHLYKSIFSEIVFSAHS